MSRSNQLLTLFAGAVFCGSVGFAQASASPEDTKPEDTKKNTQVQSPKAEQKPVKKDGTGGGVMVFIDPKTHQIRPAEQGEVNALTSAQTSKAKAARKAAAVNRSMRGPSGAKGMLLDESSMQYVMITKSADGSLKQECVSGGKNADRVLSGSNSQPVKGQLDVQ